MDTKEKSKKQVRFVRTMDAPAGVENMYDKTMPKIKQTIEMMDELITTCRKLLNRRIDDSAGKIMRLEMRSVPIIRIPMTIVIAVKTASIIL